MYYRIIPFSGSFDTYGLIYKSSEDIGIGTIVQVPLRQKYELGIVRERLQKKDVSLGEKEMKEIGEIVSDFIFLSQNQLSIVDFIAEYYITPIHNALGLYFPKNLLEKVKKNTFEKIKSREYSYEKHDILLSEKQQNVFKNIKESHIKKHLIYGVTGSGKTQIYMKLIQENLKLGKQILLLIPEIVLTSQIGERIKKVFGDEVIILHSGVSQAKKSGYWMDIYSGNAKIVIGTRSTLFYPYNNLGCIIIDEEHDESYISDNAPRYHSLDIAEKLSELYNIPLIIGSGTPRVTSFYKSLQGDFQLHQLLEKYQ